MNLGQSLQQARKNKGLSQEEVANKLGITRQTISKWELAETTPDIYQAKKLAIIYDLSLDQLIEFDYDLEQIKEVIAKSDEKQDTKIDWTKAWSTKYPILVQYQKIVDTNLYSKELTKLLNKLENDYQLNQLDSYLVLKDILAKLYQTKK